MHESRFFLRQPDGTEMELKEILRSTGSEGTDHYLEQKPTAALQDREYPFGAVRDSHLFRATVDGKPAIAELIKHTVDEPIPPGEERECCFGVDFVYDKGHEGLPETVIRRFGIERPFLFGALLIDDECAQHFAVAAIYVGVTGLWWAESEVPGFRFAESTNPRVVFKKPAQMGQVVIAKVKNTSAEPQVFKAKIVGKEPVDPKVKLLPDLPSSQELAAGQ